MKFATFLIALCATSSNGFLMAKSPRNMPTVGIASDDVDFDAPIDRAIDVGNVVRSPKRIMGVEVPSFIAKALNMDEPADHFEVGNIVEEMDEECYLGKNGDLDECVDFDP